MIQIASYAAVWNFEAGGTHPRQQPVLLASLFIFLVQTLSENSEPL